MWDGDSYLCSGMTAPVIQPATWHGIWTIILSRPVHWKLKKSGRFGKGNFSTTKTFCWRDTYTKQQKPTFFIKKEQRRSRTVELQREFYCTCLYDLLKKFCWSSDVCHKTEDLSTENTTHANSESYPDMRQPSGWVLLQVELTFSPNQTLKRKLQQAITTIHNADRIQLTTSRFLAPHFLDDYKNRFDGKFLIMGQTFHQKLPAAINDVHYNRQLWPNYDIPCTAEAADDRAETTALS